MGILDHFGLLAPLYEHLLRAPPLAPWRRVLKLPAEGLLLDVGGGTGRVSAPLADGLGGVIVLDVSRKMLMQAASRPGVQAIQAESEHLPIRDNSCGRIVMVDALHHVADTPASLRELLRVLAPGGRLVIEEPNWVTPRMRAVAWMEKLALMRSHPEPPGRIVALAREAGTRARCITLDRHTQWIIIDKPQP
jgi:SAM-dependent methyltransferase